MCENENGETYITLQQYSENSVKQNLSNAVMLDMSKNQHYYEWTSKNAVGVYTATEIIAQ
jgi:hypothetical protein